MSSTMKTPGVYIQELDAFGNSVVPVPTALPVFIGYTDQVSYNGESLLNKLIKVDSLAEFLMIFGDNPPLVKFKIVPQKSGELEKERTGFAYGDAAYEVIPISINYRLYSSIRFFYENGGGTCFIMTVGTYDYAKTSITDTTDFVNAITLLEKELEPTILVIPDIVEIHNPTADPKKDTYLRDKYSDAYSLQSEMINHCGKMMNRVTILDVPGGYVESVPGVTSVQQFRNSVEPLVPKFNSYAAAYYPWLHTTVYQSPEISYAYIDPASYTEVTKLLKTEFTDANGLLNTEIAEIISAFSDTKETTLEKADLILGNLSKSYQLLKGAILSNMNLIAPSAAMAGIYNMVDNSEGVWVAPANIGMQSTIVPAISIDETAQADLNIPFDGKSICAIRAFIGRGVLVWGARTLDGNSTDWRYINIRRTLIYIEQSVQSAIKAYTFAPNDANTWASVSSMINNFLTELWKQGGLAGSTPADAFSVSVGLGSTMTAVDILEGIMRVAVKVAVFRPAEFIEITFQQEMQKG